MRSSLFLFWLSCLRGLNWLKWPAISRKFIYAFTDRVDISIQTDFLGGSGSPLHVPGHEWSTFTAIERNWSGPAWVIIVALVLTTMPTKTNLLKWLLWARIPFTAKGTYFLEYTHMFGVSIHFRRSATLKLVEASVFKKMDAVHWFQPVGQTWCNYKCLFEMCFSNVNLPVDYTPSWYHLIILLVYHCSLFV